MNESPGSFEVLSVRVDELEKRVHALEHPDEVKASSANRIIASAAPADEADSLQSANLFPLLGRAMLGIAGAYVLRAVAGSGIMPAAVVATVAIAYSFAWLVWAARVSRAASIGSAVYAGTAAVILLPLLWGETLHFHVFSLPTTAFVLAALVGLATLMEWRRESSPVLWLAYGAAAAASIALSVAAHAMLPFVCVLLLIVLLCESSRVAGRARLMWSLTAFATDALIWGMIFIYSGSQNAREEYVELRVALLVIPACLLFAIHAVSVTWRVTLQGWKISVFEIAQLMVAFGLAISSVLLFAPGAATILGIICLVLSIAAYFASFHVLRSQADVRNFATFSLWSAALLVAGALWSLPQAEAAVFIAVAGLSACVLASRLNLTMLEAHGALFLGAAVAFAGASEYVFQALAGSLPDRPSLAVWIVGSCVTVAYLAGSDSKDDGWARQLLRLALALLAVSVISAMLVSGVLAVATHAMAPSVHHIAFLRTLVMSAVSLSLAYAGPRWGRAALTRLAYVVLAFVAAKLLFEDLRYGHMEFIAASIFVFAVTLIAVPQLVRLGAKTRAASHASTPVHA